jgi:hypothetical protein
MNYDIPYEYPSADTGPLPHFIVNAGETAIAVYRAYLDHNRFRSGTRKTYRSSILHFCCWAERNGLRLQWLSPDLIDAYADEVAAQHGRQAAYSYPVPIRKLFSDLTHAGVVTGLPGPLPQSPDDWQNAVDAAQGILELDAMKQHGLIKGGPQCDAYRCLAFLAVAKALGYTPAADACEQLMNEMIADAA